MTTTQGNPADETAGPSAAPRPEPIGPPQYEFSDAENALIRDLAGKMHFVGLFGIALGILTIAVGGLILHVGPILTGTFYAVLGLWTQRASTAFKSIVDTKGSDVTHLIDALSDLRRLYSLQYWLAVLGLTLAVATIIAVSLHVSLNGRWYW